MTLVNGHVPNPQSPLAPTTGLLPPHNAPTSGGLNNANLPPQIITDLPPPTHLPVPLQQLHPPGRFGGSGGLGSGGEEDSALGGTSPPITALSEDSTREQVRFMTRTSNWTKVNVARNTIL